MLANLAQFTNKKVIRNEYEYLKDEVSKLTALCINQEKTNYELAKEKEFLQDKFFEAMRKENKRTNEDKMIFEELQLIMEQVEKYELQLFESEQKFPNCNFSEESADLLRAENFRLKKQLEDAMTEAKISKDKIETTKLVLETTFNSKIAIINMERERLSNENREYSQKISLLEKMIQDQEKSMNNPSLTFSAFENSTDFENLKAENLKLKDEIQKFSNEIKAKEIEQETLKRELRKVENEMKNFETNREKNIDLRADFEFLKEKHNKCQETTDELKSKIKTLEKTICEKEISIDKMISNNSIQEIQIHSQTREIEHLKRRIYNLETKIKILEENDIFEEDEEVGIKGDLKKLKRNELIEKAMKLYFENEEISNELSCIENEISKFRDSDYEGKIAELSSQINEMQNDLSQLKSSKASLETELEQTKNLLKETKLKNNELYLQRRKFSSLFEQKSEETTQLSKQIEEMKSLTSPALFSFQNFSITAAEDKSRVKELEKLLSEKEQEILALKANEKSLDFTLKESIKQNSELAKEMKALQDESERIKRQLERKNSIFGFGNKEDLTFKIRELDEENISLRMEKSSCNETIRAQKREIHLLKKKLDDSESSRTTSNLSGFQKSKHLDSRISLLEESNLELREKLLKQERILFETNSSRKSLLEEIEKLKTENSLFSQKQSSYSSSTSRRKTAAREESSSLEERKKERYYGSKYIQIITNGKSNRENSFQMSSPTSRSNFSLPQD